MAIALLFVVSGLAIVLHVTPLEVTVAPPVEDTSPPNTAELEVILVAVGAVTVGATEELPTVK